MIAFAHIDHAAGAAAVGLFLRPTELLIFGNARGGTPLMESVQTIGIDLPLKALLWQDESGITWLSYNNPNWLAKRHELDPEAWAAVSVQTAAIDQMARLATTSQVTRPRDGVFRGCTSINASPRTVKGLGDPPISAGRRPWLSAICAQNPRGFARANTARNRP
ncbi:MAG: hypothetical protein JWM63_2221 [Gammaproteobacteria bacterium]|nr:hypothetical protein [Gammaproteobacteria bacterium]